LGQTGLLHGELEYREICTRRKRREEGDGATRLRMNGTRQQRGGVGDCSVGSFVQVDLPNHRRRSVPAEPPVRHGYNHGVHEDEDELPISTIPHSIRILYHDQTRPTGVVDYYGRGPGPARWRELYSVAIYEEETRRRLLERRIQRGWKRLIALSSRVWQLARLHEALSLRLRVFPNVRSSLLLALDDDTPAPTPPLEPVPTVISIGAIIDSGASLHWDADGGITLVPPPTIPPADQAFNSTPIAPLAPVPGNPDQAAALWEETEEEEEEEKVRNRCTEITWKTLTFIFRKQHRKFWFRVLTFLLRRWKPATAGAIPTLAYLAYRGGTEIGQ
jgi:hypothetical protein